MSLKEMLLALIRYRSVEEIKETLQNAKSRGAKCALLIGAGCSVKAGIPTAAGFVDVIKDKYKLAYQRAPEKTYPMCMGELLLRERRDLIAQYVDKAQINWAHLCIALLIQAGYVDRVLTTNFDLLVARACAMLGVFPAIYDFATSQLLKKADIPDQAVFYLHGQRTGFVLMNTKEEVTRHSALLSPVFEDTGTGRVWIVVGYSGENDPVFNNLASFERFDNGLFWVGYGDREPATHVREQLVTQDKDAFFAKGFDADSFFVSLTRALEIFPPDLVARPFTYLQQTLTNITPFTDPSQTFEAEDDVMCTPREWIRNAIDQFENERFELEMIIQGGRPQTEAQKHPALLAVAARYLLMQGRYEQVLGFRKDFDESPSAELGNKLSMAYVMHGNRLLDRAKATGGEAADRLFTEAREMYEAALVIKSDRHEALHNWGNLLLDLAKTKTGQEADGFFAEAEKKYAAAIANKPDRYAVLINWGNLLLERAKTKAGGEAAQLFIAAEEKYEAALAIKPDMPHALYQWGNVLLDRAKMSRGKESDQLFTAAAEKYRAALSIKPDMYEALNNWGSLFVDQGKVRSGSDADELFTQAREKYAAALAIKPDMYEALNNWGNLLLDWRKTKTGPAADQLFDQAEKKYEAALAIKPDRYDTISNWGNLLSDRARRNTGPDADWLFVEAEKKYQAALTIKPGAQDVLRDWGNLLQDWGKAKTGQEAAQLLSKAKEKLQAAGA
jgi:hypothetical protein